MGFHIVKRENCPLWKKCGLYLGAVVLALCDRILVISSGYVTGIVDARTSTKEEIGLLMTKTETGKEAAK